MLYTLSPLLGSYGWASQQNAKTTPQSKKNINESNNNSAFNSKGFQLCLFAQKFSIFCRNMIFHGTVDSLYIFVFRFAIALVKPKIPNIKRAFEWQPLNWSGGKHRNVCIHINIFFVIINSSLSTNTIATFRKYTLYVCMPPILSYLFEGGFQVCLTIWK